MANDGDVRPFVRFIADCTEKTLDVYLWSTSELTHQIPLLLSQEEYSTKILSDFEEPGSGIEN